MPEHVIHATSSAAGQVPVAPKLPANFTALPVFQHLIGAGPAWNLSDIPVFGSRTTCLQRKLSLGTVDDPLEREADRVADTVMRMPVSPAVSLGALGEINRSNSKPAKPRTRAVPVATTSLADRCPTQAARTRGGTFELAADRMASTIRCSGSVEPLWPLPNAPNILTLRRCACGPSGNPGGECDDCKKRKELRRDPAGPAESAYAPPIVHQVLNTSGEALGGSTRTFFEQRFGVEFSGVRVHSDARAAESARAVNANAYAVGNRIVFAKDRYQPHGSEGRRLLAHELAHTVQQGLTSSTGALRIGGSDDAFEHQAETVAERVAVGPLPAASPINRVTPPIQPGQLRTSILQRDPTNYAKLAIEELRKLVNRGDRDALDALYKRYEAMSNVELERYVRAGKDAAAQDVYSRRIVPHSAAEGQGRYSKSGVQEALQKDLQGEREASGITRRAPSAVNPNVETQGGTAGAARTDIPGLEDRVFIGRSPQAGGQVNPKSNFPPATDPEVLPHTHGHAEQNIADQLEEALLKIPKEQLKGRRVWMLIEQEPCSTCAQGTVNADTAAGVLKKLSLKYPEVIFEIKSLDSSALIVLKGSTTTAPGGAPAAGAAEGEAATFVKVGTKIEVSNSVRKPDGTTVSEVEYNFTENLDQVNGAAPAGTKMPSRILVRVTQNADGTLASVESISGQSQGLVEALAQKTIAGAGGEAAGAAVGGGRGVALLFRGLKIGGIAAFTVITGYQLFTATPKQRPRVLAGAAGGLAAGAGTAYVVCNVIFGLETAGWSLLFCGLVAGGAGGYAGSKAAENVYDEATATDLDKALHRLEGTSKNEIGIFNFLVGKMGSDGCIDAAFVQNFMSTFPSGTTDAETILLAAQLTDAHIAPAPRLQAAAGPSQKSFPAFSGAGGTVCPACHGRSTKELLPPSNMTSEQLEALKNIPTCDAVLASALNALRGAIKNLPPRPQLGTLLKPNPGSVTPKSGANEHATPAGVVLPPPTPKTFPTEAEQLGTKCPSCHAETGGKPLFKQFGGWLGSGPNGELTDADRRQLVDLINGQPK